MKCAIDSLCEIHTDVKTFITALELPVHDWEDKWVDVYLDNSVKLLDICIAFTSEISRLNQGHLYLQCVAHNLNDASPKQFLRARSSLDGWTKHVGSRNPRLDKCFEMMDGLAQKLDLPKIKNSAKAKKLMDIQVTETFLWAGAFADLQGFVNTEIRSLYSSGRVTVLKDLEAVDAGVKKLYPIVEKGVEDENLLDLTSSFGKSVNNLSQGLDLLGKEVDRFFQIVLTGRDALLSNLRVTGGNTKVGGLVK
ncbi:protein bps1 chloroplastic [Phtheirospermum japonicum]|uniref:Protein bps1 chloroplastic n=1 Tax=Phtheirospermum japonicum TaxID=374723 RepID=A0A830BU41_9LAMI|nr:protein bps1 chloroplastic [Phtheirospermum japonicum]